MIAVHEHVQCTCTLYVMYMYMYMMVMVCAWCTAPVRAQDMRVHASSRYVYFRAELSDIDRGRVTLALLERALHAVYSSRGAR